LGEGCVVCVAHDRHNHAPLGAYGNADVVVALLDNLVAAELRVEIWKLSQRADHRSSEERHEAEADAVTLLKVLAAPRAYVHNRGHVDLVEGREHGGGALCLQQSAGDCLATPRHAK